MKTIRADHLNVDDLDDIVTVTALPSTLDADNSSVLHAQVSIRALENTVEGLALIFGTTSASVAYEQLADVIRLRVAQFCMGRSNVNAEELGARLVGSCATWCSVYALLLLQQQTPIPQLHDMLDEWARELLLSEPIYTVVSLLLQHENEQ